jgi:hypothetical protein
MGRSSSLYRVLEMRGWGAKCPNTLITYLLSLRAWSLKTHANA